MFGEAVMKTLGSLTLLLCGFQCVVAAALGADAESGGVSTQWTQTQLVVVSLVAIAIGVSLVVVLVGCMDCCNAEVDSTNHPATRGPGDTKWGGGYESYGGSSTRDMHQGLMQSSRPGEVVSSAGDQSLPYSMFPVRVPVEAGFAGYGDQPHRGAAAAGWGDGGASRQSAYNAPQAGGNAGVMDGPPQEPPPSYSETVHTQYQR